MAPVLAGSEGLTGAEGYTTKITHVGAARRLQSLQTNTPIFWKVSENNLLLPNLYLFFFLKIIFVFDVYNYTSLYIIRFVSVQNVHD